MFCSKCGYELKLEDDTQFCPNCGKEISRAQINNTSKTAETGKTSVPKSKTLPYVVVALVIIAIIIAATVYLIRPYLSANETEEKVEGSVEEPSVIDSISETVESSGEDINRIAKPVYAHYDKNDTAHILLPDGKYITIENAKDAIVTPDRKSILVISSTGERYITDIDLKEKTVIDEKSGYFDAYDGAAIFHNKGNSFLYRYDPRSLIKLCTGDFDEFAVSERGGNILYGYNRCVYILTKELEEPLKISGYEGGWKPLYISDDGSRVYWAENSKKEAIGAYDIYELKDGEKNRIITYNAKTFPSLIPNADDSVYILGSDGTDNFIIIDKDGNTTKANMKNAVIFNEEYIYTDKSLFGENTSSDFPGVYISANADEKDLYNLYYVDKNGDREKVLSGLTKDWSAGMPQWSINDGHILYVMDGDLHCAKIDGTSVSDDELIAEDINILMHLRNGFAYYLMDDEQGLYVYKQGSKSIKIADEMKALSSYYYSPDGNVIYYFEDDDTFYKYTYGDESSVKISNSVYSAYIVDGYQDPIYRYTMNDKFTFFKEVDKKSYQWMYYNGKEYKAAVELESPDYADYSYLEDDKGMQDVSAEEEPYDDSKDWINAYEQLLDNNDLEFSSAPKYALIYLDDDSVPEIVADYEMMESHEVASYRGGSCILTGVLSGFSYIERSGLVYSNYGISGYYPFTILRLANGKFEKLAYGHESEGLGQSGEYYLGDDRKVSKQEYDDEIKKYFDVKKAEYPDNFYFKDELIRMMDELR